MRLKQADRAAARIYPGVRRSGGRRRSVEVEYLPEEGLSLLVRPPVMPGLFAIPGLLAIAGWFRRPGLPRILGRAVDDLVEFTAIEPDAPALRAIVDLDPLPVGHDQINIVYRAFHRSDPLRLRCGICPSQCSENEAASNIPDKRRAERAPPRRCGKASGT